MIESLMGPLDRLADAVRRLDALTDRRPATGRTHDMADDVLGTSATDDAVGFDPFPLLRALHEYGRRVVVIGQVAGIMHGSRELTGDLDLLWDGDQGGAAAMAAAFASLDVELRDDEGRRLKCDAAAFAGAKVVFRTTRASGDCCTPALPWGDLPVVEFLDRCEVEVAADGTEVHYLQRQDLVRMRRAAGRPKDLRRADELERLASTNRTTGR